MNIIQLKYVPNSGTASDVAGIVSATMFRNTVKDSRIVTPVDIEYFKLRTVTSQLHVIIELYMNLT